MHPNRYGSCVCKRCWKGAYILCVRLSRGAVYCGFIVASCQFQFCIRLRLLRPCAGCGSGRVEAGPTMYARVPFSLPGSFGSLGVFGHASTMASAAASRDNSSCNWPPAPPLLPLLPLCGSRQPQSCGDNLDAQSAPSGQSGGKRALLLLVWVDSGDGGGGRRNWTGPHRKPRATT